MEGGREGKEQGEVLIASYRHLSARTQRPNRVRWKAQRGRRHLSISTLRGRHDHPPQRHPHQPGEARSRVHQPPPLHQLRLLLLQRYIHPTPFLNRKLTCHHDRCGSGKQRLRSRQVYQQWLRGIEWVGSRDRPRDPHLLQDECIHHQPRHLFTYSLLR